MKLKPTVVAFLCAARVFGEQAEITAEPSAESVRATLNWQAVPGRAYSIQTTEDLRLPDWTNASRDSVTASNILGSYDTILTERSKFFRVSMKDTDPPFVNRLSPGNDAIAVASNASVTISLVDETGIDTSSLLLSAGPWTNLTLAGEALTWSNGTLTFGPTGALGAAGSVVSNTLTVADTLGHALTNFVWTFRLARPVVTTNTFLPLTAPPPGQGTQTLSIGGTKRTRSLSEVQPLNGPDDLHIVSVSSNTVVFSYSGISPSVSNGTLLVSFDAAHPFYRRAVSNAVNAGQQQITAWTADVPLTELLSEGSVASGAFVPAQSGNPNAKGKMNLLHVEFGNDLSGRILCDSAGLRLHLLAGSWAFAGDVDVAFDLSCGELRALDASATGKLTLGIAPEVLLHMATSGGDSVPLIAPVGRLFGGMVGWVPVWVEVTMELNAGYEYSFGVSGSAHTTIGAEKDLAFSVRLRDNRWSSDTDNPPIVLESDPIVWELEGTGNAKVYIQPKLSVLFYSLAGLSADIRPYCELDFPHYQPDPLEYEVALRMGLSSSLGVESRVWYPEWGGKPTWQLFDQKWLLWATNYPSDLRFVSPFRDQTVQEGDDLTLLGEAVGDSEPNYEWYYEGQRIIGEHSSQYAISSVQPEHQGSYSVRAWNSESSIQTSCFVSVVFNDMVLIPGGKNSGTNPLGAGESYNALWFPPAYSLEVSSFYMDRCEVTKAKWDEVFSWAVAHGYGFSWPGSGRAANHPVQTVYWYDCVKWCNARSEKEGRPVCYHVQGNVYRTGWWAYVVTCDSDAGGYRLPTSAEWEYAARGGAVGRRFPWGGDTISHRRANYYAGLSEYDLSNGGHHPAYYRPLTACTSPVDSFGPNGYGLYGMSGNVWEWCWNVYRDSHFDAERVIRGGSWSSSAWNGQVGYRGEEEPSEAKTHIGFRTVLPVAR